MNQREAREFIGTNHHFNPSMNPPASPRSAARFFHMQQKKPTQPIQITRQISATSDGTSSPTASPVSSPSFNYPMPKPELNKKPKIFKSFDFTD